jgi:hypothetical protein
VARLALLKEHHGRLWALWIERSKGAASVDRERVLQQTLEKAWQGAPEASRNRRKVSR